jgi:hypothetical protein
MQDLTLRPLTTRIISARRTSEKEKGMKSKKINFSGYPELSASHQRPTTKRLERFERLVLGLERVANIGTLTATFSSPLR